MTPNQKRNFKRMIRPRHVAFIGGADAIIAIGEARRRGFRGEYWPVNPTRSQLAGLPCYTSVKDLPEPPDAVFIAIPAAVAVQTIKELSKIGAGGIVCYSAGFKEAGNNGNQLERDLAEAVGDMALIGPNCYGFINYLDDIALWPFAHGGFSAGYGAAIITQSGMFSSDITMSQRSLPMTFMISAGNQAVMGLEDFVDFLSEHPETRAIGIHIEGFSDIPKFEAAALKALETGTAIVALKTGTSDIGRSLTVSHTGSLSGSNTFYEALFERCGVISVNNPSQFLETLKYLCVVKPPKGNRIAGFTCSGGGATMLADHGQKIALNFPTFEDVEAEKLRQLLPDIATVSNPLDYTTPIWGQPEKTLKVFEAAIEAKNFDATVLVQDYPAKGLDESKVYYLNDADAFGRAARKFGIPAAICATLPENLDQGTREHLISQGVAPMQGIHECLNAIQQVANWEQQRSNILKSPLPPISPGAIGDQDFFYLSEADGKSLLSKSDISIPSGEVVNEASSIAAAQALGFPLVIKMVNANLPHKTEAGAVKLGIANIPDLENAILEIRKSVSAYDREAVTDIFLIEKMAAPPLAEMIIGLRQDKQFGWTLTIGSGGILVEVLEDTKTLLLPTNAIQIEKALRSLNIYKLLDGFRGQPKADLKIISSKIESICLFVQDERNLIKELEINPLFVYEEGVLTVDVLMAILDDK